MLAPVGAQMIGALALREGTEHLDIASGTGEPGLSIAAMIPRGRVALADLSGGMLAAASANAAAGGSPTSRPVSAAPMTCRSALRRSTPSPAGSARPGAPGLFCCAAPGAIGRVFRDAGICDVAETDVRGSLEPASAEEYWAYCTQVLAPVAAGLAAGDSAARDRIQTTMFAQVRAFEHNGQPRLPLHARCTTATK